MKILELTDFSTGGCGVWHRVKQESELLSREHKVLIFSSNAVRDSNEIVAPEDKVGQVRIRRFPFKNPAGKKESHRAKK